MSIDLPNNPPSPRFVRSIDGAHDRPDHVVVRSDTHGKSHDQHHRQGAEDPTPP